MIVEFIFRWFHVLAGIVWIGMLYYFNFVQTEYFKEAEAGAKADAMKKLAPRALKWFRYGALVTFLTGLGLLHFVNAFANANITALILMGALTGTLMFLNVWLVIWPKQKIVLGMKEGDGPAAAAKAGLASRTNTLFSGPMLLGMLGSQSLSSMTPVSTTGLTAACGLIILLELNALFGRMGPMASVVGVVHMSILLTGVIWALLAYL
ncbi:urate hydroxylase PuuD [Congregibacter brevis]|uniref:Urate hydroxylase PuuD n=1 Tax=Congregibacter brevis TaxID=3081201 RepID=A0ABZ0IAG1_9GAMM|nr:urate hydroxylase PuuD [Congregibacter sp. IMCC45268]